MFNYCLPTTKVSIRKPSITVVDQISKNTSNQIYQNKTDKITMHYSLQWGQTLSCGAFLITNYIIYMTISHCSRITCYPSFIAQDFYHFSTLIHNGDNLNMYGNLRFHGEFLRKLKNCRY